MSDVMESKGSELIETMLVSKKKLDRLEEDSEILRYLHVHGVRYWKGWDDAIAMMVEEQ